MQSFKQLGLSAEILRAVEDLGFETPSDIQREAIPYLLTGDTDLIGLAQTGTGKTAAFGLPLLEKIDRHKKYTQALILSPTRELCRQITEQMQLYSKYQEKLNVLPVYGGASISGQIKALRKPQHIIVATPGRLIDLIKRRAVNLADLDYLVLDEADEMLNMGFKEEIDEILRYTPQTKRTWLFSATMPQEIKRIVRTYMENPHEVKINQEQRVNKDIEHFYAVIKRNKKLIALKRFIDLEPDMRAVVFCRTRRDCKDLSDELSRDSYRVDALHGDLSQTQRDRVMRRFKEKQLQVLIATDVAARGIDVNDLTHVFHHTLPDQMEYYTHRSGRTARAGKEGISLAFVYKNDHHRIKKISKALKIDLKKINVPISEDIVDTNIENWRNYVIDREPGNKISKELFNSTRDAFAGMTRDQLIAHMITAEIDRMNLENQQDVNDEFSSGRGGGGRGGDRRQSGRRKGRRQGGRKGRDRGNARFKKKKNHRGGKGKSSKRRYKKK